jgi:DNA polymerase
LSDVLTIDFETRSPLDIKKVGIYRYIEDPRTHVLCYAANYRGNEGVYFYPEYLPGWMRDALNDPDVEIHAHNATVERLIIQRICSVEFGWPFPKTNRFRCSAARAARLALPRALDKGGAALGLNIVKDKEGTAVMRRLTKPIKITPEGFVYDNTPAKFERLGHYCLWDVKAEMALDERTFPMPESEERYYQLTERINDRGVRVDVQLVKRLIWRANECIEELNGRLAHITWGRVTALTQVQQLKEWLYDQTGQVFDSLDKENMGLILDEKSRDYIPEYVKDALLIRQEGAKSSVAKLVAILNRVCADGRIHGAFVFNGASTGRYTSMGVQLQNLIRETLKDFEKQLYRLEEFTLSEISKSIRPCFIPSEGHVFVDADYNAVEARGVAWLAGAKKLLRAFKQGADPYCEMASVIFEFQVTKEHAKERFIGKQVVLGCGYGMGADKFIAHCAKSGASAGFPNIVVPFDTALKSVQAYRKEFHEIPKLWYAMGDAAIAAVKNPGQTFEVAKGKIKFLLKDDYLQMKLPNGRRLFYNRPQIRKVFKFEEWRDELTYMAEHPVTHQWVRESTWGGKLTENAVQGFCRDFLFEAMDEIEKEDIAVVLSVHDQIVAEVLEKDGPWATKKVQSIMEAERWWAPGFPIKAEPKLALRFGE